MCTLSVSNVIYHKFSHGAAFYTLNGKNVNVMLEFILGRSAPLAPFETVAPLFAGFTTIFLYNRNVDFQKIIAVLMRNRYFSKEISLPS